MNPHQIIVDYATAKGYDSWRVGIDATRAVRQIEQTGYWRVFYRHDGQLCSTAVAAHSKSEAVAQFRQHNPHVQVTDCW